MKPTYYKLPISISRFFTEGNHRLVQCSEADSIDNFIGLLLRTCPGEHAFDPQFGCRIWELDFENVFSRSKWEDRFTQYIRDAILKNEKRIKDVNVRIKVRDVFKEEAYMDSVTIRKCVDIFVDATIISTNDRRRFAHRIYLGPLSSD